MSSNEATHFGAVKQAHLMSASLVQGCTDGIVRVSTRRRHEICSARPAVDTGRRFPLESLVLWVNAENGSSDVPVYDRQTPLPG